jgi:proteasome lid subunit RPN8/RPN11
MNDNKDKKSNNGTIFIKKEAFRNMMTHVLRFGNEALEKSIEVMGICLGKYDAPEDKVIIENAVPITHGVKVEIGFDKEMYDLFTQIEKNYQAEIIGYYHSHPSWGLYLSESDLKNVQYFQNEKFPHGFSVVFDHTLMGKGGKLGLEIYRLDDFNNPDKYHSVSFEIETPTTLEYFKWVQKFAEDFQKKSPLLIKEINEFVESVPGELQEIPTAEIEQPSEEVLELPEISSLISGFQQGSEKLSEMYIDMVKTQIIDWVKDVDQGTSKGTAYISKAVNKMKEAISSGLLKVGSWFNRTLNNAVIEFKNSVSKYVDTRIDDHKQFTEEVSKIKDELLNNLNTIIDNNVKNINEELGTAIDSLKEKLGETTQINSKVEELVGQFEKNLIEIDSHRKALFEGMDKKIETSITPLQDNLNEKIEKLSTELEPSKNYFSEIRILLERLQKIITDFRNIA